MSKHCTRFLEVLLLLTGISLSFELPTRQIQQDGEVFLAYNCIHVIGDKPKDLPPVFMLHGLMDNKNTWDGIDSVIAMRTGRRVCTVDARNHGDSDWSNDFNIDVMADDVMNLMKKMKVEKAAFVGHSMGGLISMNIAHRQPEKVEIMVIEDIAPDVPKSVNLQILNMAKLTKQIISMVPINSTESEAQDFILDYMKKSLGENIPKELSEIKRNVLAIRRINGTWQWKANMDAIIKAFEDTESFFSKAKRNTYSGKALFIYGTISGLKVLEEKDKILKYFPKAEFVEIEGASHNIHPFYPQFLAEVLKFLESSPDFQ